MGQGNFTWPRPGATSNQAIVAGANLIETGNAQVVIAGGAGPTHAGPPERTNAIDRAYRTAGGGFGAAVTGAASARLTRRRPGRAWWISPIAVGGYAQRRNNARGRPA